MVKNLLSLSKLMILIAFSIIVFGTYSAIFIPKESSPDVQLPTVSITATDRGMSPVDVETLITRPIEREVLKLNNIDEVISRSYEGRSYVRISFESGVDIKKAINDVRDKVDVAKSNLPNDTDEPIINESNVALFPIISVGITSETLSQREIIEKSRQIKEGIEDINGVFEVDILGDVEDIVSINVPVRNLYSLNIKPSDISNAIISNNVSLSSGSVDIGNKSDSFSAPGLYKRISDFNKTPVFSSDKTNISLEEIAKVKKDIRDKKSSSFINNNNSITLEISKNIGESSLSVVRQVKEYIEGEDTEFLDIFYMEDSSEDINKMLTSLSNNVLLTMLIVFTIILFFMGLKSAISLSLTIPMSFFITFTLLFLLGYTINSVALFGLILVTGMLVDSAIVVSEYADKIRKEGVKTKDSYIQSSIRMAKPIAVSTITTVFAFLPIMFWPGTTGDFMMYIPLTVIITLISSFFVSLFILPTIAGALSFSSKHKEKKYNRGIIGSLYKKSIIKCIRNPIKVITISIVLALGMVSYYYFYNNGMSFFPSGDSDFISVRVYKEGNKNLESMEYDMKSVSKILEKIDGVSINSSRVRESNYSDSIGNVQLQLKDWRDREDSNTIKDSIIAILDNELPKYLTYKIQQRSRNPGGSNSMKIEASSKNIHKLNNFTNNLIDKLKDSDLGFYSVSTERKNSDKEYQININEEKAKLYGIDKKEISSFISFMTNGVKAGDVTLDDMDEKVDVLIYAKNKERSLNDILSMNILGDNGWIPIKAITSVEREDKTSVIRRTDGKRVINITADANNDVNVFDIIDDVENIIENEKDNFNSIEAKIRGQVEDTEKTSHFMIIAFLSSIILMLSALLYQFNSYIKSLIVFVAVAFSTIGVLFVVSILNQKFSVVFSGLAVLSLAGISINHNIILIDEFLYLKEKGSNSKVAALLSATSRFKPIMLTVLTTSLGLLPMIFEVSVDFLDMEILVGDPAMATWSQMASNIAGGLFISAIISLLLTPTILSFLGNKKKNIQKV